MSKGWTWIFGLIGAIAAAIAIYQFATGNVSLQAQAADSVLGEWLAPVPGLERYDSQSRLQFFNDGAVLMSVTNVPESRFTGDGTEQFVRCEFEQQQTQVTVRCPSSTSVFTIAGDRLMSYGTNANGEFNSLNYTRVGAH